MAKKKFIVCDLCTKTIWTDMYRIHLENVHGYNSIFSMQKAKHDIEVNNAKGKKKLLKSDEPSSDKDLSSSLNNFFAKRAEKERDADFQNNTQTIQIIWDDISFGKDCIKFNPARTRTIIKPYTYIGLIESLNQIKEEYFQRLFSKKVFQIAVHKGNIIPERSAGLMKILQAIDVVIDFHSFKFSNVNSKIRINHFNKLSNLEIIEAFHKTFAKSDYLKYLASRHDHSLNIIPIIEFSNNKREEAFLFRFKTHRGRVMLVWENVNEARASHIFTYPKSEQNKVLEEIENFVCCEDFIHKRSSLYLQSSEASQLRERLYYLKSIKHENLSDYTNEIERLLQAI